MSTPELGNSGNTTWPQVREDEASSGPPPTVRGADQAMSMWGAAFTLLHAMPEQVWTILGTMLVMLFAKWLFTPQPQRATGAHTATQEGQSLAKPDQHDAEPTRPSRWGGKETPKDQSSATATPTKVDDPQPVPKSPTTTPQSFGPKEVTKTVEPDKPVSKGVAEQPKTDANPKAPTDAAGTPSVPATATTPATTTAPSTATPAKATGTPKAAANTAPQVTAQVMYKSIQEVKADVQGLSTRIEAIEKISRDHVREDWAPACQHR